MRDTITRKEIAQAANVSCKTVERKESEWGIDKCRSNASTNPVLYFRPKVSERLVKLRVISKPL